MILLNKLLPLLISPMVLIFFFSVITIFLRPIYFRVLLVVIIYIFSNPLVGSLSVKFLEKDYRPGNLYETMNTRRVLVLGGVLRTIKVGDTIRYEFNEAVDRFDAGINLIKYGKADFIIFTRGKLPWSIGHPEGEILSKIAIERGVDAKKIELTKVVNNTLGEAKAVKEMLSGNENLILVTSAFHMKRAMTIFQSEGIRAIPFAVDFRSENKRLSIIDFFPSAEGIINNSLFVREIIGRHYYSLRAFLNKFF